MLLTGIRVKPYLTQIVTTILWRLNNKSAKVRQQAADLTSRLAVVIKQCGEDQLLSRVRPNTGSIECFLIPQIVGCCAIRATWRGVSGHTRKVSHFIVSCPVPLNGNSRLVLLLQKEP